MIGKAETMDSGYRTVLDMDSTAIPVYGGSLALIGPDCSFRDRRD